MNSVDFESDIETINALKAALAQGVASFVITLLMIEAVQFLCSIFETVALKVIMPAVIVTLVSACGLSLMHLTIGTNSIIATVSAPLLVGFSFSVFTAYRITR